MSRYEGHVEPVRAERVQPGQVVVGGQHCDNITPDASGRWPQVVDTHRAHPGEPMVEVELTDRPGRPLLLRPHDELLVAKLPDSEQIRRVLA